MPTKSEAIEAAGAIIAPRARKGFRPPWQWEPPQDQEWFKPGRAAEMAERLVEPHREAFARFLAEQLQKGQLPKIAKALDYLDRVIFGWEVLEALSFGAVSAATRVSTRLCKPQGGSIQVH